MVSGSSDDVGEQLALELDDEVLQHQLSLLEALELQLVEARRLGEAADDLVEIAMLAAQALELRLDCLDVEIHPDVTGLVSARDGLYQDLRSMVRMAMTCAGRRSRAGKG